MASARDLDSNPRHINYAKRRQALSTWQMSEADWIALCSGIPKLGRLRAKNDPSVGTVLAWAQATQADHLLCPIITTPRHTRQDTKPLVNKVSQFLTPTRKAAASNCVSASTTTPPDLRTAATSARTPNQPLATSSHR